MVQNKIKEQLVLTIIIEVATLVVKKRRRKVMKCSKRETNKGLSKRGGTRRCRSSGISDKHEKNRQRNRESQRKIR